MKPLKFSPKPVSGGKKLEVVVFALKCAQRQVLWIFNLCLMQKYFKNLQINENKGLLCLFF